MRALKSRELYSREGFAVARTLESRELCSRESFQSHKHVDMRAVFLELREEVMA